MISSKARAVRAMSQPWLVSGVENPKPGIDGATTWNAGAGPTPDGDARAFGEHRRDARELDERRRVAVAEQQRHGRVVRRAHVQPVDRLAVDLGEELRQAVEPRLLAPASRSRCASTRQALRVAARAFRAPTRR